MRNRIQQASLLALAATHLSHAADCRTGYTTCAPAGATATSIPTTGPELAPLYDDLLSAVKGISFSSKRSVNLESRDTPALCCNEGLSCVNVGGFNIAMCYDQFTTNFRLLDGSTGTIASGAFSGSDGGSADLRAGTYSKDGSSGNLYASSAASYSPTNSASIPAVYTSAGVGSAVPLSALGEGYITTTVTVQPTTDPGTTVAARTSDGTVISGTTRAGTTVSTPFTTVMTTSVGTAAAVTSTSSKDAGDMRPRPTGQVMGILGVAAAAMLL